MVHIDIVPVQNRSLWPVIKGEDSSGTVLLGTKQRRVRWGQRPDTRAQAVRGGDAPARDRSVGAGAGQGVGAASALRVG